jgi:hypothetical protein
MMVVSFIILNPGIPAPESRIFPLNQPGYSRGCGRYDFLTRFLRNILPEHH